MKWIQTSFSLSTFPREEDGFYKRVLEKRWGKKGKIRRGVREKNGGRKDEKKKEGKKRKKRGKKVEGI